MKWALQREKNQLPRLTKRRSLRQKKSKIGPGSQSVGGCPLQQARADPTSTHLFIYDCSLKSILSIYIYIYIYMDLIKYT